MSDDDQGAGLSRRQMIAAGTTGLMSATAAGAPRGAARGRAVTADGTPEQIHLTWGADPTNGDLAHADAVLGPATQPQVSRDFGNTVQASAANRPWMPVPANHEFTSGNGAHGLAAYLTRYTLPSNGVDGLDGRWYAFRVGTALFVCLSGDDVAPIPAAGPATRAARRPGGSNPPWRRRAPTRRSTGSWCSCTSAPARRLPAALPPAALLLAAGAPTWGCAGNGCRFSTATRSTSCCPGTTTATSGPSRSAAATPEPAPTRAAARPSTPGGATRAATPPFGI